MSDEQRDREIDQLLRAHAERWRSVQPSPPLPGSHHAGATPGHRGWWLVGIVALTIAALLAATIYLNRGLPGPGPIAGTSPTASPTSTPTDTSSPTGLVTPTPLLIAQLGEVRSGLARLTSGAMSPAVRQADDAFAFSLYQHLLAGEQGNMFLSPYSVITALSMTYAGARGDTARQLADALGISADPDAWAAARSALDLQLTKPRAAPPDMCRELGDIDCVGHLEPLTLEPTNAIFGQAGLPFEGPFLDTLAADYGAGMHTVDFATATEPARAAINAWVNERTHGRIPELLPRDSIDSMTAAVLVNAIYFQANWWNQFDPEDTREAPFNLLDGTSATVGMMHGSARTDYATGDGWQAFRLPYVGGASMLVIVPDAGSFNLVETDLANITSELGPGSNRFTPGSKWEDADITLGLPKWESESALSLVPALESMGIADLFDWRRADLSGITTAVPLYVTDVLHQANITVDESGTEAAAATAVVVEMVSLPRQVTLTVDRPFLYLITDDATGEILFMGRVLDPSGG